MHHTVRRLSKLVLLQLLEERFLQCGAPASEESLDEWYNSSLCWKLRKQATLPGDFAAKQDIAASAN
jgi:hypothetical protein